MSKAASILLVSSQKKAIANSRKGACWTRSRCSHGCPEMLWNEGLNPERRFRLARYLDEEAFQYNERKDESGDRVRLMSVVRGCARKRPTHRTLTGKVSAS